MTCAFCGSGIHVWWDCPKKPDGWKPQTKSTAALTEVSTPRQRELNRSGQAVKAPQKRRGEIAGSNPVSDSVAGTQAPPVDTKLGRPRTEGPSQGKSKRAEKMKTYMREWRARQK